jgi:hypothetical protein
MSTCLSSHSDSKTSRVSVRLLSAQRPVRNSVHHVDGSLTVWLHCSALEAMASLAQFHSRRAVHSCSSELDPRVLPTSPCEVHYSAYPLVDLLPSSVRVLTSCTAPSKLRRSFEPCTLNGEEKKNLNRSTTTVHADTSVS